LGIIDNHNYGEQLLDKAYHRANSASVRTDRPHLLTIHVILYFKLSLETLLIK